MTVNVPSENEICICYRLDIVFVLMFVSAYSIDVLSVLFYLVWLFSLSPSNV